MNSRMAVITFMDNEPGRPDNTLPGSPNYPTTGPLPPGASLLPVFPFDPTVGIDNTLPGTTPPVPGQPLPPAPVRPTNPIAPGNRYVVKWFACHGLILVPDNTLPTTPQPK
jgi:hypothetical protein